MQQLRRFLVPIILLFVLLLAILLFGVSLLRRNSSAGDAATAGATSASSGSGGLFGNLFPQAAGPVQMTAVPAAQVAAPAPAAQPTAAAPAAVQPTPAPTAIPAPTAVAVQQLTPVPPVTTNGNVISGNAGVSAGGSASAGDGEAGGVGCGTRVIHTVRAGENLFRIGLRYNTTASAIARLNRITNVRNVSVGRRLVVVACARGSGSSGAYYSSRSGTYTVRAGDTLFGIASRFGINVQYLCRVNGLYTNLIVPGQTLVIP